MSSNLNVFKRQQHKSSRFGIFGWDLRIRDLRSGLGGRGSSRFLLFRVFGQCLVKLRSLRNASCLPTKQIVGATCFVLKRLYLRLIDPSGFGCSLLPFASAASISFFCSAFNSSNFCFKPSEALLAIVASFLYFSASAFILSAWFFRPSLVLIS